MLPTFVIGLREGLEGALIISIVATFLRSNGQRLRAMWLGVGAAVALAVLVGVVLQVVEQRLPQARQEAMSSIIGGIAVFFVTGMVLWMRTHARSMKRQLESAASAALSTGTSRALVAMAFLAVLREGFETSVFLLSTFGQSNDTWASAGGAVLGLACSIAIGVGIYSGGVRLNLTRFFKVTGVFLVFVAAGLVLSSLRTGHSAGFFNVGQGHTVDLGWLAPPGSIRTALVSGVLGIPGDPRVIEVIGWAGYLVPMLLLTLWPASRPLSARTARAVRVGLAGGAVIVAVLLATLVTLPDARLDHTAPLAGGGTAEAARDGDVTTLTLRAGPTTRVLRFAPDGAVSTDAGAVTTWTLQPGPVDLPARLSAVGLLRFTGGRAPVGLDFTTTPGPFDATWRTQGPATIATTADAGLVRGSSQATLLLSLRGGGLASPRVITVEDPSGLVDFAVAPDYSAAVGARLADLRVERGDREVWRWWVPVVLLVAAGALLVQDRRSRPSPPPDPAPTSVGVPELVRGGHHRPHE